MKGPRTPSRTLGTRRSSELPRDLGSWVCVCPEHGREDGQDEVIASLREDGDLALCMALWD